MVLSLFLIVMLAVSPLFHPTTTRSGGPPLPVNCAEQEFFFSDQITLASLGRLIFRWTGSAWERLPAPTDWDQLRVAGSGAIYLYSDATNTIYSSTDLGQSWNVVEVSTFANVQSEGLYPSPIPGVLFLSLTDSWSGPTNVGIWKSTDDGQNWRRVHNPGGALVWLAPVAFSPGFAQDGTAFVARGGRGTFSNVLKSTDWGESWFEVNNGLFLTARVTPPVSLAISAEYPQDGTVFGGLGDQDNGFYKTVNGGAEWTYFPGAYFARPLLWLSPGYAADQTLLIIAWPTLYLSTDGGVTQDEIWGVAGERPVVVGLRHEGTPGTSAGEGRGLEFWAVAQRGPRGAACYLYRSVDGGATWEPQRLFETPYNQHLPLVSQLGPN